MIDKPQLHQHCLSVLNEKIDQLKADISDAQKAASEDTKSSAGDKFETSREMIKQSINQLNQQLSQNHKLLTMLEKIKPETPSETIGFGSLVQTNEGWYYFSVSLGKLQWEGEKCFALSMASPLGKALCGKVAGETITFMKRTIRIHGVS
ncbi:MAG: 3-oxoacyl-ACP synthase [Bacteroidota bacterium]